MLRPVRPAPDDEVGEYFSQFYESVRDDRDVTWSSEYASRIVRHTFDRTSPIAQYATVPKAFVFIQRINLGLYALLGELQATGNYRRIAEELWPFVQGRPARRWPTPSSRGSAAWPPQLNSPAEPSAPVGRLRPTARDVRFGSPRDTRCSPPVRAPRTSRWPPERPPRWRARRRRGSTR